MSKAQYIKNMIKKICLDDDTKIEERILSSLSCKSQSYTLGMSTFGALTQSDLNMAMSTLNKKQSALIYAKYQSCPTHIGILKQYVILSMQINLPSKLHTSQITEYLLNDIVSPKKCRTCKGVGEVTIDNKRVVCPACDGSPNVTTSQVKLGQAVGVSQPVWSRNYHKPYMHVIEHFESVQTAAIAKMKKRLIH